MIISTILDWVSYCLRFFFGEYARSASLYYEEQKLFTGKIEKKIRDGIQAITKNTKLGLFSHEYCAT